MFTISSKELENAKMVLANRFALLPEDLKFLEEWRLPELGKTLLMFLITDPTHNHYGSTVTYTGGMGTIRVKPYHKL